MSDKCRGEVFLVLFAGWGEDADQWDVYIIQLSRGPYSRTGGAGVVPIVPHYVGSYYGGVQLIEYFFL